VILKYEKGADKKVILTSSRGHNLYPSWSTSGKSILFLSNRDSAQDQVYTMDSNGEHLKRLSPPEGFTEWASWCKTDN
jgi:Tol biopolymer transport system component